jgi:hypothetical protein
MWILAKTRRIFWGFQDLGLDGHTRIPRGRKMAIFGQKKVVFSVFWGQKSKNAVKKLAKNEAEFSFFLQAKMCYHPGPMCFEFQNIFGAVKFGSLFLKKE